MALFFASSKDNVVAIFNPLSIEEEIEKSGLL
jgi:hypothetical protein